MYPIGHRGVGDPSYLSILSFFSLVRILLRHELRCWGRRGLWSADLCPGELWVYGFGSAAGASGVGGWGPLLFY